VRRWILLVILVVSVALIAGCIEPPPQGPGDSGLGTNSGQGEAGGRWILDFDVPRDGAAWYIFGRLYFVDDEAGRKVGWAECTMRYDIESATWLFEPGVHEDLYATIRPTFQETSGVVVSDREDVYLPGRLEDGGSWRAKFFGRYTSLPYARYYPYRPVPRDWLYEFRIQDLGPGSSAQFEHIRITVVASSIPHGIEPVNGFKRDIAGSIFRWWG